MFYLLWWTEDNVSGLILSSSCLFANNTMTMYLWIKLKGQNYTNPYSFICISNYTDEQTEYNIYEQWDKGVEINFAEDPCQTWGPGCQFNICVKQVISIDHRVKAFCSDS